MPIALSRRAALAVAAGLFPASTVDPRRGPTGLLHGIEHRLSALEQRSGARLALAIQPLVGGHAVGWRVDGRVLMCSTFKTLLTGLVLTRVDRGEEALDRSVPVSGRDIVVFSPVTGARVGGAMTISELCEATLTRSDNTAANLLLEAVGGPASVTRFVRDLGDTVTRLDRIEPALNEHDTPDDERDTTTPGAILDLLRKLTATDILSAPSRSRLVAWLIANQTGDDRLRAGFPPAWTIGDKTGANGSGTTCDIAIAWPTDRAPFLVAAWCRLPEGTPAARNALIAEMGRLAADAWFGEANK